jgi:hypothetical protein
LIFGAGWNRQESRIAWRNGDEVGVEFILAGSERSKLIAQISEEARKVFDAPPRDASAFTLGKWTRTI